MAGEYLMQVTGGKAHVGLLEGIPGHETGDSRLRASTTRSRTPPA